MSTVTSAGTSLVFKNTEYAQRFIPLLSPAQCLYVLTDDNPPAIDELRSNGAYVACLLTIARPEQPGSAQETKKGKARDAEREAALSVLSAGILRNIEPIPPPSIVATVDIDRDVVLPTLEPVLVSMPLAEASQQASELIVQLKAEEVRNSSVSAIEFTYSWAGPGHGIT